MKNKLMLVLLVSMPVAVRAMEPAATPDAALKELEQGEQAKAPVTNAKVAQLQAIETIKNDPLEHLKEVFNTKNENEVANHVRHHIPGLEGLQQAHLLNGLKSLGQEGKLVGVNSLVSTKRSNGDGSSATAQDIMQTTIQILSAAYAVATNPQNQQALQQVEDDIAKSGSCLCLNRKK